MDRSGKLRAFGPTRRQWRRARLMIANCVEILGLPADRVNVEFTQHDGDEMYHPTLGGYSPDWSENEV